MDDKEVDQENLKKLQRESARAFDDALDTLAEATRELRDVLASADGSSDPDH